MDKSQLAASIKDELSRFPASSEIDVRFTRDELVHIVNLLVSTPPPKGGVFISLEMLRFLHGADPLHGVWFGEEVGTRGRYWWRKELPPIPEPSPSAAESDEGKK